MVLDVSLLKQFSSELLCAALKQIPGDKDLIIEERLMRPIDKFAGMTMLKTCGVKRVFRLSLLDHMAATSSSVRVYLLSSSLIKAKVALEQVKSTVQPSLSFHIMFVPRLLQSIANLLEEEGLVGKVTVSEFMWQFIPLDSQLLSMELGSSASLMSEQDLSSLSAVSRNLFGFESLYGSFSTLTALGKKSQGVLNQLKVLESKKQLSTEPFGHLLLIDRDFDFVSPLLSPVSYEALLDEVFGISCGVVELSSPKRNERPETVKLELSNKDKIFDNIRCRHFSSIFSVLSANAKQLRQKQTQASAMSVTEMKDFVNRDLKELQNQSKSITLHIEASEQIQKEKGHYYEDLLPLEAGLLKSGGYKEAVAFAEQAMARLYPIEIVLRFMCLISCISNGLVSSDYFKLKKIFCQAYGFKHCATFSALNEVGLLKTRDTSNNRFNEINKNLNLIVKNEGGSELATPFNGIYVPVISRMANLLMTSFSSLADTCTSLPNCHFKPVSSAATASKSNNLIIFFVGGYTLAELASLKALQAQSNFNMYVGGTQNLNGKSLMQLFLSESAQ